MRNIQKTVFVLVLVCNLEVASLFSMNAGQQSWRDYFDYMLNTFLGNHASLRSELMYFNDDGDPVLHADIRCGDLASVKRTLAGVYNTLGYGAVDQLLRQVNNDGDASLQVALKCKKKEIEQVIRGYMQSD